MPLYFYRALLVLLSPFLLLHITWRLFRGREDWNHLGQRLGRSKTTRPKGQLVWFHGASVGEVMSLLPVLQSFRLTRPDVHLLLTTGTRTGFATLSRNAESLGGDGQTIVQYVPLDFLFATRRFINHWQPDISVFTESDFWPNLLSQAPHPVLLNGRVSDRSWPRYQRYSFFFRPLIARFEKILAQRDEDALRLKALGATQVEVGGNLKFDAPTLSADDAMLEKLRAHLGRRPIVVAASTHQGEEELIAQMHMRLKAQLADVLTIIVPRHPHRGTQAVSAVMRITRAVARRGVGDLPHLGGARHTDIYVADTLGELGLWYRLADVAIIGGTLVKVGGHNPLEALKLNIPVVTGPHMFNFKDMTPLLIEKKLITVAPDVPGLAATITTLLQNPNEALKQRTHIAQTMPTLAGASANAARYLAQRLKEKPQENPKE